jgi:hypothetical protein
MGFRHDDSLDAPFYELDAIDAETSLEAFDRLAFAREAIARMAPRARVAVCSGARQVRVLSGRLWGARSGGRWVLVSIPPSASRRAIVHAVAEAGLGAAVPAYFYDVLLGAPR